MNVRAFQSSLPGIGVALFVHLDHGCASELLLGPHIVN